MKRTAALIAFLLPLALLAAVLVDVGATWGRHELRAATSTASTTPVIRVDAATGSDDPQSGEPFRTIGAAVTRAERLSKDGTAVTVLVVPGTYRESIQLFADHPVGPLTIEGTGPGVVITGADEVARWGRVEDGLISIPWREEWGKQAWPDGWSDVAAERGFSDLLRRRELVIIDGGTLRPASSREELTSSPGTFLVEEHTNRILAHPRDARPTTVEVATRQRTLSISGRSDVTIRDLAFVHAASKMQSGSVRVDGVRSVLIEDSVFADNVWGGLELLSSSGVVVRRSVASGNGVAGFTGWHNTGVLLEDTLNTGNNRRGAAAGLTSWDGVSKFFANRNITLRRHESSHNAGHGVWFDMDSSNIVLEQVRLEDNDGSGVFLEALQGPVRISDAAICRNGAGGVVDGKADAVTVATSTLADNERAQILFTGAPGGRSFTTFDEDEHRLVRSSDWRLERNTLIARESQDVVATTLPADDWDVVTASLTSSSNRYESDAQSPFRLPGNTKVDLEGWDAVVDEQGATLAPTEQLGACTVVAAGPRTALPAYPAVPDGWGAEEIDAEGEVAVAPAARRIGRSCPQGPLPDGRIVQAWDGERLIDC